ncbi:uncharacterized protein [Onthophagus taurus]|uniref:uncharacterized protein n=1 Tax=Onthophagus taurus TaxID=166361 RepID=UPI0039BE4C22
MTESKNPDVLFERQNDLYGLINRTIDNLKKLAIVKRTRAAVKTRLERLDVNWEEFNENHKFLSKYKLDYTETIYFSEDLFSLCEESYLNTKSEMIELLESNEESLSIPENVLVTEKAQTAPFRTRNVPVINLPKFDGDFANWTQFRDLFNSMVYQDNNISNGEKLQYLKMCLINEPARLIKNLLITNDNMAKAWEILVDRYENRRLLINTQLAVLFSSKSVKSESSVELKRFLGEIKEALGALEALNCSVEHWDNLLVYLFTRKLDSESIKEWEKVIGGYLEPPSYVEFEKFLFNRLRALESIEKFSFIRKPLQSSVQKGIVKSYNATPYNASCAMCNANHYLSMCQQYLSKTPIQRSDFIKSKNLCFNCLGPHLRKNCRNIKRCKLCNKNHHTSLHDSKPSINTSTQVKNSDPNQIDQNTPSCSNMQRSASASIHLINSHHINTPVFLATAMIGIFSETGESVTVRALIDHCSEVCFISESLVQRLNLPRKTASIPISGVGSQRTIMSHGSVRINLFSKINNQTTFNDEALILPKLTSYLPKKRSINLDFNLDSFNLADPEYSSTTKIELILGVSIYSRIIEIGIIKNIDGSLVAQQTSLGWFISGILSDQQVTDNSRYGFNCSIDHELLEVMQSFWKQEEYQTQLPYASSEEYECEEHFKNTHDRDISGRFVVRLPFRKPPKELGNSLDIALKSFNRLELRFAKNEKLKTEYSKFMKEYLDLDHMRQITSCLDQPHFYLPHHGVIRESSTTTKLRVVFNGSQKSSSGLSLNDCLNVGPKLQTELVDVLLRWRRHPIVFACDLEKMYRQIRVHQDDWPFQQILWREKPSDELKTYQLCTVTYGLSSAPYLALKCIKQLAEENQEKFPQGFEVLRYNTYVDDILSGAETAEEAHEIIYQLNTVLKMGGFTARKWISNETDVLNIIPSKLLAETSTCEFKENHAIYTLGLLWVNHKDEFLFKCNSFHNETHQVTKRNVLSFIARLYDPLGWLSPLITSAKILMQELWIQHLDWDDILPIELKIRWNNLRKEFSKINTIRIPRWIGTSSRATSIELHGFADASIIAYGAVLYLRVSIQNELRVSILVSKSKVSPLKRVTIPRLELCAAVLLVRLLKRVQSVLKLFEHSIYLWTDSTVVLSWIRGHPSRWKDYVRNRVTEIHEVSGVHWNYVPGEDNPADLVSRLVTMIKLQSNSSWWSGPCWLMYPSTQWPKESPSPPSQVDLEQRVTIPVSN